MELDNKNRVLFGSRTCVTCADAESTFFLRMRKATDQRRGGCLLGRPDGYFPADFSQRLNEQNLQTVLPPYSYTMTPCTPSTLLSGIHHRLPHLSHVRFGGNFTDDSLRRTLPGEIVVGLHALKHLFCNHALNMHTAAACSDHARAGLIEINYCTEHAECQTISLLSVIPLSLSLPPHTQHAGGWAGILLTASFLVLGCVYVCSFYLCLRYKKGKCARVPQNFLRLTSGFLTILSA